MSSEKDKIAHLRFHWRSPVVNLIFFLEHKDEECGEINEEITAVRQETETINELFAHIRNKIMKIIIDNKLTKEPLKDAKVFPEIDLRLSFKGRKNKTVFGERILKELRIYKNLCFNILGYRYSIRINEPYIEKIKLPDVIYTGHSLQPSFFKGIFVNSKMSQCCWYKSKNKVDWEETGKEYNYLVQDNDEDHYLKYKYIPINEDHQGIPFEVISEQTVIPMPILPKCPFESRHIYTNSALQDKEFRVVSYNILSCRYTQNQYNHCPEKFLAVDYRKQLIYKELLGYNADIICLQEVDSRIHSFYFRERFTALGYTGIYNKKGNRIPEGLSIFFKTARFGFDKSNLVIFNQEIKTNNCMKNINTILKNDSTVRDIFMKQVTSLQYLQLKSKNTNELIILANTHLYYHPDAQDVRLLQAAVCLNYLKQLYDKASKRERKVSVIFCGDFNSLPDTNVFEFITTGTVEYDSKTLEKQCNTTLKHPFKFESACATTFFTNYTEDFKGCLDYIFYDGLECTGHVPFFPENILAENVAIPSPVFPSDHVALIADMKLQ